MRTRRIVWLTALSAAVVLAAAVTGATGAWVSFENVRKKTTTGPAGPHLILFDPSIPLAPGEH